MPDLAQTEELVFVSKVAMKNILILTVDRMTACMWKVSLVVLDQQINNPQLCGTTQLYGVF